MFWVVLRKWPQTRESSTFSNLSSLQPTQSAFLRCTGTKALRSYQVSTREKVFTFPRECGKSATDPRPCLKSEGLGEGHCRNYQLVSSQWPWSGSFCLSRTQNNGLSASKLSFWFWTRVLLGEEFGPFRNWSSFDQGKVQIGNAFLVLNILLNSEKVSHDKSDEWCVR